MIRKTTRLIGLFFVALLSCVLARAQEAILPVEHRVFLSDETPIRLETAELNRFYLVPLHITVLDLPQVKVWRKLDRHFAIVSLTRIQAAALDTTYDFELWPVNDQWKLSANLLPEQAGDDTLEFTMKTTNAESLGQKLTQAGWSWRSMRPGLFKVVAPRHYVLSELLPLNEVVYVGLESGKIALDSRVLDMNPNTVNRIHHEFPELDGNGRVLSIREGAYNTQDIDLRARHLPSPLQGSEPTNHATEMATIAAGAGNSSLNGRGVASGVTLTSSLLEALLPDADADYQSLNAWVQNHSYGTTEPENFYGAGAEAYDQSANNNPQLLHIFSAGNAGEFNAPAGSYAGLEGAANLTGNFKLSKNSLSIASVDTVGRLINFVSKGPAHDGRIKPELVAYSVFGSSNSAALTSGLSVLLQQAYQQQFSELPPSALLKALLINAAVDVAAAGPDYATGYGNVDAYRSLQNLKAGWFTSDELMAGEEAVFSLTVPQGAVNLKATLVWNDPAAMANANIALVNDLDLKLRDSQGQEWLPWVLNPDRDRIYETAQRTVDRLNNVEQVTMANPVAGELQLIVNAHDIPVGRQEFYIAWQWDMADVFDWSFPTGSDNMPYNGETVSNFRWKSTLINTLGRLEYSIDHGQSWELIDNNVDLRDGYYRWDAPLIKSAARARMVVGGTAYETDEFTISRPERVGVGFNCTDSVRLQWPRIPDAMAYEVLTLGERELEPVASTTDTSYTFTKSDFETRLFSVQPVLSGDVRPLKSATLDYDFQGVGCYLSSFITELVPEEGVYSTLTLGTVAGVEEVALERQFDSNDFEVIATVNRTSLSPTLRLLDAVPYQGLNNYRARVLFQNGQEVVTDVSAAYFLTTRPFLVFPNPLPRGEALNIFSRSFPDDQEVTFSLYDHTGIRAFSLRATSDRFSFNLERLQPGVYFYQIVTLGITHKGRVILE